MPSSAHQETLFKNHEEFCDTAVPLLSMEGHLANHLMESGLFVGKDQITERNEVQKNKVAISPQPKFLFDWGHFWVGFQIGSGVTVLVSALILIGKIVVSYCTISGFTNTAILVIILKAFLSLVVWLLFRLTINGRFGNYHVDDINKVETQYCRQHENPDHEFDNEYDNAKKIWFTLGVCLGLCIIAIVVKFTSTAVVQ